MVEPRYQNRIPIHRASDPHLRGIGLVAYSWAVLEGAIERIIWRAAKIEDANVAMSITTHMNIQSRLDAAKTLLDYKFPSRDATKRLKSLDKHIRNQLMGLRNEIVHSRIAGPMVETDDLFVRTVYRARGTLKRDAKPIKLDEYEDTSNKILAAATEARDILSLVIDMIKDQSAESSP